MTALVPDTPAPLSACFADNYDQARQRFLGAAIARGARIHSDVHPTELGAQGEALAIDCALVGSDAATHLLVITSGVHGVEGFCGSGCQLALLHDEELLARLASAGVALLLIHAINPYGFSHLRRVNEDNIDLNRNFLDFDASPPPERGYADIHDLLLPESWPPDEAAIAALQKAWVTMGEKRLVQAVSSGQSVRPDGLFYAGREASWSHRILRNIMRKFGESHETVVWMDLHTGLGPRGHGEKIFDGADDAARVALARQIWGADVVSPAAGQSVSTDVRGSVGSVLHLEAPHARTVCVAMEFGTRHFTQVLDALRGDQWLHNHPLATPSQRAAIKAALKDAFYVDADDWRGMVVAQTRVAAVQVCFALGNS